MRAIQVSVCGSPEVMKVADLPVPVPGPGQALVKIAASGVNYIDVYFRSGLYKADVPMPLVMEGAGTVEAVGEALAIYRRALDGGIERFLEGRPVQPVFRPRN